MSQISGDLRVSGSIQYGNSLRPDVARSNLGQDELQEYPIPLTAFRVWDALQTPLPGTPATDDLGISGGTFGTHSAKLTTGDVKALGTTTRYARVLFALPPEYDAGQTVQVRINGGMETTAAGTSAVVDVEAYLNGRDGTVDGSDLCTTAAQSINNLTFAEKSFTLTAAALSPGDELDIRITITVVDAATATVVQASIGECAMVLDIRG